MKKDARAWQNAHIASMQPPLPRQLKVQPKPSKDPVFEEWSNWELDDEILPMTEDHYYYVGNMEHVEKTYIQKGIIPRVTMRDFTTISKLTVADFGGRVVTVHSVPDNYEELLKFTKIAGMPYRGEGISGITFRCLMKLLKPTRIQASKELRKEITAEQEGKCSKCGTECKLE